MASTDTPKRRFLAEPLETTSRSNRRQHSDRSNFSQSPSDDSASTSSSMAATAVLPARPAESSGSKNNTEHVEHSEDHDVRMTDVDSVREEPQNNAVAHAGVMASGGSSQTAHHKPRRKFAVEPVETVARSSKKFQVAELEPTSPKRKLSPEFIEIPLKSSKNNDLRKEEEKSLRPRRKFAVEPIETTSKSSKVKEKEKLEDSAKPKKSWAVEPVETTTRRSKDKEEDGKAVKPKRKFAVEPVETSTRSNKATEDDEKKSKPKKKFAVEPVETTTSSSRKKKAHSTDQETSQETPSRSSSGGRKFTPELVGTAKGQFRKRPTVGSAVPKWLKQEVEEDEGSWSAPELPESKFSAANLAKKARADPRRHSYCVPDLPMIQSDSSEDETEPVTPSAPSHVPSREQRSKTHHHQTTHNEHLQALKTLREQAVAAYGDQEDHVPFGHYGGDSDDEDYSMSVGKLSIQDGDPHLFRRNSQHDLHLVMEDMRKHHDQLEAAKRDLHDDTAGISRFSAAALAARHHLQISHPTGAQYASRHETKKLEQQQEDPEMAQMRKAASPPMQGNEIKFPFSVSPKMTRCDPDQMPRPRRANSAEDEEHEIGTEGMWSAMVSPSKAEASAGLWGGLCQRDSNGPTRPATPLRSGLQTPAYEISNPFGQRTPGGAKTPGHQGSKTPRRGPGGAGGMWGNTAAFLPLTPPRSKQEKSNDSFTAALDQKLAIERQIDEEFTPRVITQIYNYLSLGYPPIARPFDEELAKISRISMVELRKGDRSQSGSMKGHVGLPEWEGEAEEDEDGRVRGCRRWDALRVYVREWARQSPLFQDEMNRQGMVNLGTGMWGNNAPVRKGSWGF